MAKMQVITNLQEVPKIQNLVLTIGTFDGVHLGHQQLIHRIKEKATSIGGECGMITFHPHPRMILNPGDKSLRLLTSIEEKARLLRKKGLDYLFVVPFSADFSAMSAESYVRDFLVGVFHPKCLVIGYDHRFGKGRNGDVVLLQKLSKELHYEIDQVDEQTIDHITLSSTQIRTFLNEGNIQGANEQLGYSYSLEGYVIHGDKRGRTIGFPTANLKPLDDHKLIPKNGVYAVHVLVENFQYYGMLNIGLRPTFDGHKKSIEVHILDFDNDLYGKKIVLTFVAFIREEKLFPNPEQLTIQLEKDKSVIQQLFMDRKKMDERKN